MDSDIDRERCTGAYGVSSVTVVGSNNICGATVWSGICCESCCAACCAERTCNESAWTGGSEATGCCTRACEGYSAGWGDLCSWVSGRVVDRGCTDCGLGRGDACWRAGYGRISGSSIDYDACGPTATSVSSISRESGGNCCGSGGRSCERRGACRGCCRSGQCARRE